ncbi:MAG: hypothetical protein ACREIS_00805 [Nitrospiraceae bacterium]
MRPIGLGLLAWAGAMGLGLWLLGCAGRAETARYEPDRLPSWILAEWARAQEEMLQLPDLREDPRRFGADEWNWVQLETEFWAIDERFRAMKLRGATEVLDGRIIICCGDPEVVRHEAFHAILWRMGDPRFEIHYPELRSYDPKEGR